jgi:N-acetylmuramoyl-L-alanine amidase
MVMRFVMVFVLLVALSGCLKKTADENALVEPAVTDEAATVAPVTTDASQGQGTAVSVEPAETQVITVEKPSNQDIQTALKNINLYEGKIDGIMGPNTRKAIEAFQSQNGLTVDGKVGSRTWHKLKEHLVK